MHNKAVLLFSFHAAFSLFYPIGVQSFNGGACKLVETSDTYREFPEEFKFGVSTAAYQIEGGWNADGRGPSIWDTFTHEHSNMIDDHSNGDVGPDSYHLFDKDLEALKELGVHFYRFSISWSRILPNGDITSRNQKGIDYYNTVIDKLLDNGIEPLVTMFHYDLPEALNLYGGFTNYLFIDYFVAYARLLFESFGDRVKHWITFNEPFDYCIPGYGDGNYPPLGQDSGVADYLCMDNTLKAHAKTYQLYKMEFKDKQNGKIGITISSRYYFSKTNNATIIDRAMQYGLGWLAYPIFGPSGNYPPVMLKDINENSQKEGRAWPRLKTINTKMSKIVKGSADFLGLNYYTSRYVEEAKAPPRKQPSWEYDSRLRFQVDSKWKRAKSVWLYCVPEGLENLLNWIRINYNNVEVFVTENGWSDDGELMDYERIDYLKAHLQAVLNALNSGCNVTRYTHWSLIDNFEWQRGYTEKFGLYYVNMTSVNKERVAKHSAIYYKAVIEKRKAYIEG
ncbi:myrosinase 1-like [Glossina fuscipes]|uniref:Myrosinase 1-like n=1 Tax=Glossina fuscipes TaxID=7396 RepID=A0A8U0WFE3_9MUSC|nr:myrosinase 1-like [Glossina fuscipes]